MNGVYYKKCALADEVGHASSAAQVRELRIPPGDLGLNVDYLPSVPTKTRTTDKPYNQQDYKYDYKDSDGIITSA